MKFPLDPVLLLIISWTVFLWILGAMILRHQMPNRSGVVIYATAYLILGFCLIGFVAFYATLNFQAIDNIFREKEEFDAKANAPGNSLYAPIISVKTVDLPADSWPAMGHTDQVLRPEESHDIEFAQKEEIEERAKQLVDAAVKDGHIVLMTDADKNEIKQRYNDTHLDPIPQDEYNRQENKMKEENRKKYIDTYTQLLRSRIYARNSKEFSEKALERGLKDPKVLLPHDQWYNSGEDKYDEVERKSCMCPAEVRRSGISYSSLK